MDDRRERRVSARACVTGWRPARAPRPAADAARSIVVLHSTDAATVFLSVWARTKRFEVADLEQALYEDRSLVRMLAMRRTLWVVPRELVAVVQAAAHAHGRRP